MGATLAATASAVAPIVLSAVQIQAAGIRTQAASPVRTAATSGMVLEGTVELPPQATEVLSAPLGGVVQQVLVGPGQRVRQGETLARLGSAEWLGWQRELKQAQAQERLAASKLERDETLHAEGIISGLRLQDSRTQHELARLTLQERQQALQLAGASGQGPMQAGMNLRASAAGTVLEVLASPGQRLEAGMPVAKLARDGALSLALQATREQAQQLRVGDALTVEGCTATARVAAIVPAVNTANQSVQLRADMARADPCLRVHQFVQATLSGKGSDRNAEGSRLSVPLSAIVRLQGKTYAFVRTDKGFQPTEVRVAASTAADALIADGLKASDQVAVQGIAALKGAWQGVGGGEQ